MSTQQDDGRPGRDQIEIDALFAAQQSDRRRQRARIAWVTVAAVAAGGVTGGIAVGAIGGEDGGTQPVAGSAGPSAEPTGSSQEEPGGQDTDVFPDSWDNGSAPPSEGSTGIPSPSPQQGPGGPGGPMGTGSAGTDSTNETQPGSETGTPTAPQQPARHVVQHGESLWKITASVLGESASAQQILDSWPKLYEANRQLIGHDPDLLYAGQELVIPALV